MPQSLTLEKIKAVKSGLSHYFAYEAGETSNTVFTNDTWSDLDGIFKWKGRDDYFTTLSEITGIQNIKEIKKATFILDDLERSYSNSTAAPEYSKPSTSDATRPENLNQTTVSEKTNESIFSEAEKRNLDIAKTRENAKNEVQRSQDRLKEIYDQQKIIQDQISKAQQFQQKIDGKKIYASVEQQETPVLKPDVKQAFETLTEYAVYTETRTELIDQITEEIKTKAGADDLFARTAAVQVVNDLADIESAREVAKEAAIQDLISKDKLVEQIFQKESALIEIAKKGAVLQEIDLKDSTYLPKEIARNIFGKEIAEAIYGQDQIRVTLSSTQNDKTTHEVDLGNSNKNYINSLKEKNSIINSAKETGIDKTRNIFSNNANSYLTKKAAKAPEGSLLKRAYSKDSIKGIFSNYGLAEKVEWQSYNRFGSNIIKYFPESAPYFKLFGEVTGVNVGFGAASKIVPITFGRGAVPLAKIAYIQPIKSLGAPYTLAKVTGSKFAVGLGAKTAGQAAGQAVVQTGAKAGISASLSATLSATFGSFAPVIGNIIGAIIGWIGGELLSKLKTWWTKNKENIKPFFAMFAGGLGLLFGGPAIGGLALLGGLAVTGTLGAFAAGTIGVLGFIGRSIGVAIATPVIITFLSIPPIVAFILLVINNSAYVVPPDAKSLGLNTDNPYILITKVATPNKIDNPTSGKTKVTYTVTIKALKSPLSNLSITGTSCKVSKKDASTMLTCPPELENVPALPEGLTISPSSSYTFNFTSEFDSKYADTSIFDSIKIKGDSKEKEGIETSASESVCIGNCPKGCFVISDNNQPWSGNSFGSVLEGATLELTSKFPDFVDKVCSEGKELNLCYTTKDPSPIGAGLCNRTIYAIHKHTDNCDINFNQCSLDGSQEDALFLLTHELVHHIENIDGSIIDRYESKGAPKELPLCSYSGTNGDSSEGAAEAMALYANGGTASFSTCSMNFVSQYPKNYSFAKDYMSNP